MSNYVKSYDGAAKDAARDPVAGQDFDTEFAAIQLSDNTKVDMLSTQTIGGVKTMTGANVINGTFTGDLTGDVTGNTAGDIVGGANSSFSGTVTGVKAVVNGDLTTADGYATNALGGTMKMRVSGTTLYIRNDGTNA